jgi:hypothetical protein
MDARNIEPRTVLWAVAEISWEDQTGIPYHAPATLEDISASGACIRVKTPVTVGSKLVVRWQREQFLAVARNCRSDGRDFLLGVRRDTSPTPSGPPSKEIASHPVLARPESASAAPKVLPPAPAKSPGIPEKQEEGQRKSAAPSSRPKLAPSAATVEVQAPPPAPPPMGRSAAIAPQSKPGTTG